MTKINSWAFAVPNDEVGRLFMKQLVQFRNKRRFKAIRKRGRNSNRINLPDLNYCRDIPNEHAESFKVYLDESLGVVMNRQEQNKRYVLHDRNRIREKLLEKFGSIVVDIFD